MNSRTGRIPVPGASRARALAASIGVAASMAVVASSASAAIESLDSSDSPDSRIRSALAASLECVDAERRVVARSEAAAHGPGDFDEISWTVNGEARIEARDGGASGSAVSSVSSSTGTSAEVSRAPTAQPGVVAIRSVRFVTLVGLPGRAPLFEGWQFCEERRVERPRG